MEEDNEAEFLAALVASERVAAWLDTLRGFKQHGSLPRARTAVRELKQALEAEVYAQEARSAGAVPVLTGLLKRTDDEALLNDVSDALAACSGLMATSGGKPRTFTYGGIPLVLKEGAVGDGVGAKVWTSAHVVCRELAAHPAIVAGLRVLEIGAGCGACGILAAKLEAASVDLTDYVGAVLRNLRDCVHLNAPGAAGGGQLGGGPAAGAGGAAAEEAPAAATAAAAAAEAEELGWDPEDASECGSDDFGALLAEAAGGVAGAAAGAGSTTGAAWDAPPMRVRFYDWQVDVDALGAEERAALAATPGVPASTYLPPGASIDTASNDVGAPVLAAAADEGGTYDVILGTDILYEWPMVLMVPAVIKRRLRPGGRALLCCAVREQVMFDAFVAACTQALGLRVGVTRVQPKAYDLLDVKQEYEGGYVLVAIEHTARPPPDR